MEFDHDGETFEGGSISIDNKNFRNCTFQNVVIQYAGGPVEMVGSTMNSFSFQFGGDLAQGLFTLYQLFGTDGMLQIIRGFTDPQPGEIVIKV
ncbi:MAG: hypothetical protein KF730_17195 [Sphingomonas sp.]|uniref:hypothetical protein n=1 Tax=Sphingomonas sp. TaxID=28214 RepID=UPI0025F1966F|nr:hypothetical protein [Sphingomonas sp.]MBX3566299.1 hypothetical protein [Sphingomonas sp.]